MVAELTAQMRGGLEAAVAKVRALDAELAREKAESAALRARLAQQERARADEEEEDDEDEDDDDDDEGGAQQSGWDALVFPKAQSAGLLQLVDAYPSWAPTKETREEHRPLLYALWAAGVLETK